MMTEQQILNEIQAMSLAARISLLEKISRSVRESFESKTSSSLETKDAQLAERKAATERLRGALKMDNPPMTKEEVRDLITEHLLEKHK